MDYKLFVTAALEEASEIANKSFGKVSGTTKEGDNNQVLTETDLEIGKLLVEKVQKQFPSHNIIDEEAGVIENNSEFTWVIDPIDGTSNFANGVPTYGIMIGLLQQDKPLVGGISLPFFKEILYAEHEKGSFCNGERIFVSKEVNLLNSLIAYGIDGHQEDPDITFKEAKILANIVLNVKNLRSSNSAFDAVMVAKGKYGGSLNRTTKIWDNVAQQIIIEEAGGIYTDFWGEPMNFSQATKRANENFTMCAGAPALHKKLQEIIKQN